MYPADPSGVPQDFICAWRTYAATAVSALRADAAAEARAALQLDVLPCNAPPAPAPVPPPAPAPIAPAATELWVDASAGNDTNSGTPAAPLATVGAALARSRGAPRPTAILIRAGVYRLAAPGAGTLELGAADSGLTIAAAPGAQGAVWLSGALALPPAPTWTPVSQRPAGVEVLPGENAAHGCNASAPGDAVCGCAAATSAAACEARFVGAANATAFTWHDAAQGPTWALKCCLRHDGVWAPAPQAGHVAGRRTPALNIWSTQLDAAALPAGVPELRVNGARVPRARTPNGDPETQQFPVGWVPAGGQQWHPPAPTGPATEVRVSNAALALRNSSQNANYSGGIGGPCVNFSPPFSYWCAAHPAGGGGFQYYVPGGMTLAPGALPAFSSPAGNPAVLQLWRAAHWANWQLEIAGWVNDTGVMRFGRGGFQGARGGPGSDFYVENARELLDAPSEYFYDPATGTLFFFPNGTDAAAPPAADTLFEVPTLQTLLRVNASQAAPAAGVTLAGLGFKDAAPTYFEPFGVPSGGDWALARTAAVFVEGSERLAVDACAFSRVGGNALMLSGYNRDARIVNNSARWTGATAFAAWGRTDELADGGARGWDATAGDFPLRTVVEGNLVTETGVWSKQSSCWFQAKAALTTLVGNVCFNLARAGFNFNDGLGGGDEVHRNVIFNRRADAADARARARCSVFSPLFALAALTNFHAATENRLTTGPVRQTAARAARASARPHAPSLTRPLFIPRSAVNSWDRQP